MSERVAAIVGPTVVGKSHAAISVAEALDAEIVSLDSMQVYRGMDIGTDKPSQADRERVRHHLLDEFEPSHELTVAEFQQLARTAIAEIAGRGRLPLLVGGSGLYFRAVVDELKFPPRAPEVRAALEAEVTEAGPEVLHARLRALDPVAAARIEPTNARRTVRALEVIELTGRPFSDNDSWERYESIFDLRVVGLTRPRDELYARMEERVDSMLEKGLVQETLKIASQPLGRTARQALGYRQVLEVAAATSPAALRDEIVRQTKRFARRQESWFRADPRIEWLDARSHELASELLSAFGRPA